LPEADVRQPVSVQDELDSQHLYQMLENEVIPLYYEDPEKWMSMVFQACKDVVPAFSSDRMAAQYYRELYNA
jgi:starch phosphorylase